MAIPLVDAVVNIFGDDKELTSSIDSVGAKLRGLGAPAALAGAAITGSLGLAAKSAVDFGGSMAEISTLGVKDMDTLESGIRDIAATFGTDLKGTAEGAYQAISATGLEAAEATDVLRLSTKAAAAGVADVSDAVGLGTGTMNAFGLEVGDMEGIFSQAFVAVKNGVTTFGELASTTGKLAPTFAAAGLETDEMFASITAVTKAGIKTSEAVSGIKAAMANVIKPSKDAADTAKALGLEFNASAVSSQGLAGFLAEVKEKSGGNVETMAKLFGSVEALNTMLILTGEQNKDFSSSLEEMTGNTTAMGDAFDTMAANDPGLVWRQLKSQLADLAVEVGQQLLPALGWLAEKMSVVVNAVRNFSQEHPTMFKAIVATVGILGTLLTVIGGLMVTVGAFLSLIAPLAPLFTVLAGAAGAAGAGIAAFAAPIALAIAAIAGIVWAVVNLYETITENWDLIKQISHETWEGLKSFFDGTIKAIHGIFEGGINFILDFVERAVAGFISLKDQAMEIWDGIVEVITNPIESIKGVFSSFTGTIMNLFGNSVWPDAFKKLESSSKKSFSATAETIEEKLADTERVFDDFEKTLDGWVEKNDFLYKINKENIEAGLEGVLEIQGDFTEEETARLDEQIQKLREHGDLTEENLKTLTDKWAGWVQDRRKLLDEQSTNQQKAFEWYEKQWHDYRAKQIKVFQHMQEDQDKYVEETKEDLEEIGENLEDLAESAGNTTTVGGFEKSVEGLAAVRNTIEELERMAKHASPNMVDYYMDLIMLQKQSEKEILDSLKNTEEGMDDAYGNSWFPDLLQKAARASERFNGEIAKPFKKAKDDIGTALKETKERIVGGILDKVGPGPALKEVEGQDINAWKETLEREQRNLNAVRTEREAFERNLKEAIRARRGLGTTAEQAALLVNQDEIRARLNSQETEFKANVMSAQSVVNSMEYNRKKNQDLMDTNEGVKRSFDKLKDGATKGFKAIGDAAGGMGRTMEQAGGVAERVALGTAKSFLGTAEMISNSLLSVQLNSARLEATLFRNNDLAGTLAGIQSELDLRAAAAGPSGSGDFNVGGVNVTAGGTSFEIAQEVKRQLRSLQAATLLDRNRN